MKIEDIQMRPFACHQSSISCAHGCERCFFYKERWGVELRGVKVKEGATLGTIYHRFQKLGQGNQDLVRPWVMKKQVALMDKVDKGEDLDGQMLRLAGLLTTLYNKAEAMAKIFWERYPTPSYLKTIGTEIEHSMTIQSGPLAGMVLEGIIDKLVQDTRNSNVWIRDHKSTGMKTLDVIFAGFVWSPQARMYRILAKDYIEKNPPSNSEKTIKNGFDPMIGFILDGILKPGIKLCKKDDKNAGLWKCSVENAYLRRVKEWYAEYSNKNDGRKSIESRAIMFNEPLYPLEFSAELCKMYDLSKRGNNHIEYQRDPSRFHCFLYDSPCIYHDLCESPKSRWAELFETKYKIKEPEKISNEEQIARIKEKNENK